MSPGSFPSAFLSPHGHMIYFDNAAAAAVSGGSQCSRIRHILTGSFNTVFLHLLTFDSLTRGLNVTLSVPAQGPHQWLALGSVGGGALNPEPWSKIVYATTWADDRRVSAWRVGTQPGKETIEHINSQPITAAGSYLTVQPPPYDSRTSPAYGVPSRLDEVSSFPAYLYQAGGPTGEVFRLDLFNGAIEEQVQSLVFLSGGQEELDRGTDTSRRSLRYGAHNIDFDVHGLGYVADLGRNAILVYSRDNQTGRVQFESQANALGEHDGPRHVVPSPDGRWVFSVTEHTSYVDAYRIDGPSRTLTFRQRSSLIPPYASSSSSSSKPRSDWRGNTVRLSPSGRHLFATTRGKDAFTRGWIGMWELDLDSETQPMLQRETKALNNSTSSTLESREQRGPGSYYYETATSGGKANALEWASRFPLHSNADSSLVGQPEKDWAVLTDDEQGFVTVLEWDGQQLREVARIKLPGEDAAAFIPHNGVQSSAEGASHAIWLD